MENPAAWHPDPLERHELRYWDGAKWTEHVSDAGVTAADPLGDPAATDQTAGSAAVTPETSTPAHEVSAPETSTPAHEVSAPETSTPAPAASTPAAAPPAPAGSAAGQFDQAVATMSRQATNGIATSAMVVGIIALVFSVIPVIGAVAGFPLGGYAAIAGIIGLLISKKSGQGRGASITGIVLGGLALAIATLQAFVLGQFANELSRMMY